MSEQIEDPEFAEELARAEKPYRDLGRESLEVPGRKELFDKLADDLTAERIRKPHLEAADKFIKEVFDQAAGGEEHIGAAWSPVLEQKSASDNIFSAKLEGLPEEQINYVCGVKQGFEKRISEVLGTGDTDYEIYLRKNLKELEDSPEEYFEARLAEAHTEAAELLAENPNADLSAGVWSRHIPMLTEAANAFKARHKVF